jgi:hypothetical protein
MRHSRLLSYVAAIPRKVARRPGTPTPDHGEAADLAWATHPQIRRVTTTELGVLMQMKVALVAGCAGTRSLRDFGGLYLVHGKYLLEPAVALGAEFASMIDLTPRTEFAAAIEKARSTLPGLEVEFVNHDFRDPELYKSLRAVDTSILFEVLLHQENYISVLQSVASKTERYICIAQPCLKEAMLGLPGSASLLQFWPESLKNNYRATYWPAEPRTERFDTASWMWGHTVSHLIAVMHGIGWIVDDGEIIETVYGQYWDYPLLRFRRE